MLSNSLSSCLDAVQVPTTLTSQNPTGTKAAAQRTLCERVAQPRGPGAVEKALGLLFSKKQRGIFNCRGFTKKKNRTPTWHFLIGRK